MTAQACIHTRLGYLAGTWPDLPELQLAKLCSEFCRPLRVILGLHRPPLPGYAEQPTSNAAVCRHLKVAIPEMALVAARLQFAIRVAARECSYVTDILRSDGGQRWREAVVRSCGVIRMLVPAKVASLPDPAVDILAWEASWRAAPGAWKLLVKAAVRVASKCPWKTADVLRAVGLNVQSVVLSEGPSDEFLCELCCKWWPSKGSLAQHRRRAHGDLGLAESARAVVTGSVCPACGKDFFSRIRVCRHLKWGASLCRDMLDAGALPSAPVEEVLAADATDRALRIARRKAGLSSVAGPRVSRAA